MNALEQLKQFTTVVADTGDIDSIGQFRPQDATTNPSLLFKAAQMDAYQPLIDDAMQAASDSNAEGRVDAVIDQLSVIFGCRILEIIPGRVSTEVDARLSFDTQATITQARRLIELYRQAGVDSNRVLIKIASTWEGIRAAEVLEREGIHCNLTLLFGFGQAVACAEAGVTLISPFVGRIYDWYKQQQGVERIPVEEDPGVQSVTRIYQYFKKFEYPTEVMGASFRTAAQVTALSGCDLLTISPALLTELQESSHEVPRRLDVASSLELPLERIQMSESVFRWMLNEDAMATEKLAQGIRGFATDLGKLRELIGQRLGQPMV